MGITRGAFGGGFGADGGAGGAQWRRQIDTVAGFQQRGSARSGQGAGNGRMGTLLDLGGGFYPDLTGRENGFISAIVAGLTRREVKQRFEAIVEFAELEGFIDNPVRTYSTGMQMRLAFAVATHTEPNVLFVDEFLSVGDVAFQAKGYESKTNKK